MPIEDNNPTKRMDAPNIPGKANRSAYIPVEMYLSVSHTGRVPKMKITIPNTAACWHHDESTCGWSCSPGESTFVRKNQNRKYEIPTRIQENPTKVLLISIRPGWINRVQTETIMKIKSLTTISMKLILPSRGETINLESNRKEFGSSPDANSLP